MKLQQKFIYFLAPLLAAVAILLMLMTGWSTYNKAQEEIFTKVQISKSRITEVLTITDKIMLQRVTNSMRLLKQRGFALGKPRQEGTVTVNGKTAPNLYLGDIGQGNNFELVDGLTDVMDGTATIFSRSGQEYVRITTNVIKNDKRAIGTILSPGGKAIKKINNKQAYYGHVDILGMPFLTAYEPILNTANEVIGIWYVGYSADLQSLAESIAKERLLDGGFVALLDNKNNIRMHSSHVPEAKIKQALSASSGWSVSKQTFTPWGYTVAVAYPTAEVTSRVLGSSLKIFVEIVIGAIVLSGVIIFLLRKTILKPLRGYITGVNDLAKGSGDLTVSFKDTGTYEFDQMSKGFNDLIARLRESISSVSNALLELSTVSDNLDRSVHESNETAENMLQQSNLAQQKVIRISEATAVVANNTGQAMQEAESAKGLADSSYALLTDSIQSARSQAEQLTESMQVVTELAASSENIGSVMDVISEIADQTNLLALNAAIEAARAGEQGRGFAVVADEVRQLASRTQASTGEIKELIEQLQAGSSKASSMIDKNKDYAIRNAETTEKAGSVLAEVQDKVTSINAMNSDNSTAAEEQRTDSGELRVAADGIQDSIESNVNQAKALDKYTQDLRRVEHNLKAIVQNYKT